MPLLISLVHFRPLASNPATDGLVDHRAHLRRRLSEVNRESSSNSRFNSSATGNISRSSRSSASRRSCHLESGIPVATLSVCLFPLDIRSSRPRGTLWTSRNHRSPRFRFPNLPILRLWNFQNGPHGFAGPLQFVLQVHLGAQTDRTFELGPGQAKMPHSISVDAFRPKCAA